VNFRQLTFNLSTTGSPWRSVQGMSTDHEMILRFREWEFQNPVQE